MIVDVNFCYDEETNLTIHKTSVFFPGDGFLVYDTKGQLLFRFDSYCSQSQPKDELVVMDSSGKCLLTLLRKKPSLHQRWEGFMGEKSSMEDHDHNESPIFTVHRSSIIRRSSVIVQVYNKPNKEYLIEGSYPLRCCTIYDTSSSKDRVADIKRKVDPTTNQTLGKDVFCLCLEPGFDGAFAMGLVLVLDQMYGDDEADGVDDQEVRESVGT
ncbi:hypothetical protein ACFE04_010395 [Oxalis oulophora]